MSEDHDKSDIRSQLSDIQSRLFKAKEPRPVQGVDSSKLEAQSEVRSSLGPESKGNDMNYVVGLSQNLISECRRLNAENQKLKSKLKSCGDEVETLKSELLVLGNNRERQLENESELKNKNWELQSQVVALNEQVNELVISKQKLVSVGKEQALQLAHSQKLHDELQLKYDNYFSASEKLKITYTKELNELNNTVQQLNDENDKLTLKVQAKNTIGDHVISEEVHEPTVSISEDEDEESESLLVEKPQQVAFNENNTTLEIETLRASLNHSNQTISKLRNKLLKQRAVESPNKGGKLTKRSEAQRSVVSMSPSKRDSKILVIDSDEDKWEDFIGDDLNDKKRFSMINSTTIDSEGSPVKMSPEKISPVKMSHVNADDVEDYARDHNLVLISFDKYESLLANDISSLSIDKLKERAKTKGLVALTSEEYDILVDEDEMKRKLYAKGLVTIETKELDELKAVERRFKEPSLEYINEHGNNLGFRVIKAEEFGSLMSDNEEHKRTRKVLGENQEAHRVLEREYQGLKREHQGLQNEHKSLQNEHESLQKELQSLQKEHQSLQKEHDNPQQVYLFEQCKQQNLVAIPTDKFNSLQKIENDYDKPSAKYIKAKANELGLVVTTSGHYDQILQQANNPTVDELQANVTKLNMVLLSSQQHQTLIHPNIEQLTELAKGYNMSLVPVDEWQQVQERANSPTIDHMRNKLMDHNYTLLPIRQHQSLLDAAERPSIDTLTARANNLGFSTIKTTELESLQRSANLPSLNHVKVHAENLGLMTLSKSDYVELYRAANDPSIDELRAKADSQGHEVVDKQTVAQWKAPNLNALEAFAKGHDHTLIPNQQYQQLTSPDLASVTELAKSHGHCVVPLNEYAELREKISRPSLDYLTEHIMSYQLATISPSHLQALQAANDHPSREYLDDKAREWDCQVVPNKEYHDLKTLADSPNITFLQAKAKLHGFAVIKEQDYVSPNSDYLHEKAQKLGLAVIDSKELESLKTLAHHPSLDDIIRNAQLHQSVVVSQLLYNQLQLTVDHPSRDHLITKANALDLTVLDNQEYEALTKPSKDQVEVFAQTYNCKLVEEHQLEAVYRSLESPLLDYLREKAGSLGFTVIDTKALDELKSPTKDQLLKLANSLGLMVIATNVYTELTEKAQTPSLQHLKTHAKAHDSVLITNNEYNKLQHPDLTYLQYHATNADHTVVPISEYDKLSSLIAAPTREHLEEKASSAGLCVIPKDEYTGIKSQLKNPSLDFLNDAAAKVHMSLVSTQDYQLLLHTLESPTKEYLDTKLKSIGHVIITNQAYNELIGQLESPELDYLEQKAKDHEAIVVKQSEYEKLLNPNETTLREFGSKLGLVTVAETEFRQLQEPSLELIRETAKSHGYDVISCDAHNELNRRALNPTKDELVTGAQKLDLAVVDSVELAGLRQPIEQQAKKRNHVILPQIEYDTLLAQVQTPSLDYLGEKAGLLGSVVVDKHQLDTFHNYKALYEDPNIEYVQSKFPDHVIVDKHQYSLMNQQVAELNKQVNDPELQYLHDSARKLDHVLVSDKEYNELRNPSRANIDTQAESMGLKTLSLAEYVELTRPSIEQIGEYAANWDHRIVSRDEYELLNETIDVKAQKSNLKVIPLDEYEKLTRPLEYMAKEQGKTVINQQEYEKLVVDATMTSLNVLKARARESGMEVLPVETVQELQLYKTKTLEERAEEEGMKVVSKDEYDSPSLEYLLDKAKSQPIKILPLGEYNAMTTKINESVDEKALQIGKKLVDQQQYSQLTYLERDPIKLKAVLETKGYKLMANEEYKKLTSGENAVRSSRRDSRNLSLYSENFVDAEESFLLDEEELRASAGRIGMVVLKQDEYIELVSINEEDVQEFCKEKKMVVIAEAELIKLKQDLIEKESQQFEAKETELTKETVLQKLNEFGLVPLTFAEYELLKSNLVENITGDKVKQVADKFGMVAISQKQHRTTSDILGDVDEFTKYGKSLGVLVLPQTAFVPTLALREPDIHKLTAIPTSYYMKLLRNDALNVEKLDYAQFKKYANVRGFTDEVTASQSPAPESHRPEAAATLEPARISTVSQSNLSMRSAHSISDTIHTNGILSIATNISLTDESIIPAIAQTVIGEFVWKYHRKLGPFQSIGGSRHERYFWVNPYTLTLYWSAANPVLSDPSGNKTRGVAIVSLESVDDNNPLPPGIYHKSIIVHSHTRSVKFTCSNRKRHNIWLNALRYLINRDISEVHYEQEDFFDNDEPETLNDRRSHPRKRVLSTPSQVFRARSSIGRFNSLKR